MIKIKGTKVIDLSESSLQSMILKKHIIFYLEHAASTLKINPQLPLVKADT